MKAKTRHFTLIEILVVVVLISMLVGITVPAYTRIMTGNAVSYGSRILSSQLNMARTEACSRRRNVALVFLNETGNTITADDEDGIYNRRAFRVCYVNESGEFEKWLPGSKWEMLPKGTFLTAEDKYGESSNVGSVFSGNVTQVEDDGDKKFAGTVTLQSTIIFDSTGRPVVGTNAPQIVIAEGTCNTNTAEATLKDDADAITRPNTANWAICKVNRYTGKVSVKMNE